MKKLYLLAFLGLLLSACGQGDSASENDQEPVRGLKTVEVTSQEQSTVRRYPSVLQPTSISTLSFEIAGKLEAVELNVGQQVKRGEVVASLDRESLEIQVETAEAAVLQARSNARNAEEDFKRQQSLFDKKVVTVAALDKARTTMETSNAQLLQSEKQLETAQENLQKAELRAPYDAVINTVETQSFSNVGAGTPIATIYSGDGLEASFSVSYDVISRLAVGKAARIRLADNPDVELPAVVTELGSSANTVSSFPVVITLQERLPQLKAGMAVEVSMEFDLPAGAGYALPISVLTMEGRLKQERTPDEPGEAFVYVFDPQSNTVKRRLVRIGGIRENRIIVVDGLEAGERVASAGVSFLRDGQTVKLLN